MPTRFGPTRSWMIAEKRRSKYTESGTSGSTTTKVSVTILVRMIASWKRMSGMVCGARLAVDLARRLAGAFVF